MRQVLFFILDSSFKRFENCTVKLSAKETKWTSLEVRTHPTFLETLILKYDFGPVKLPGASRNGLQVSPTLAPCPDLLGQVTQVVALASTLSMILG